MTNSTSDRKAPKILLLHADPDRAAARIAEVAPDADVVTCTSYEALPETLERERPEIAFTFKIGKQLFPRETLVNAPSLRWVQHSGAGIDHLVPWNTDKLTITNASGAHGAIMSQYTIWAILNHQLGLPTYAQQQRDKTWKQNGFLSAVGKTLVIVGFGAIGSELGGMARAMGMKVIGVRTRPEPSPSADEVVGIDKLHEALGKGDYVSVVLPITPQTRNIIDGDAIGAMKKGAYLINTGRGGIVEETALLDALRSGHLSGALLDVFAQEPLPQDNPLWEAPNTVILPHTSGDAGDWKDQVTEIFCKNLKNWMNDRPLFNTAEPGRGY